MRQILKLAQNTEIEALNKAANAFSTLPEVEKVVVFGSRVRGDFKGSSDIDVLIVLSDIHKKNRVISILHNIELEYEVPISPVIFTKKEYEVNKRLKISFIKHIEREGIVLYDANQKR